MSPVILVSPCLVTSPDCGACVSGAKKKCCKKYKKKGKTNCRRCPKLV